MKIFLIHFLTYSLAFGALVYHLIIDLHKKKRATPILHWLGALTAVAISCVFGVFNQVFTGIVFWKFAIFSLCIHFAIFDLLWNKFNRQPWYYNGDPTNPNRAWTDRMWDYIPPYAALIVRALVLVVGWLIEFKWQGLVNYWHQWNG